MPARDSASIRQSLLDGEQVQDTILRLVASGELDEAQGAELARRAPVIAADCGYILGHLGSHLGIGAVRAILVFIPLGSVLRASWVAGSRLYETVRGNSDRARIHSLKVFLIAAIPFAGYFSYLVPLRASHEDAAYLYANHISFIRYDASLAVLLSGKPALVQRLVERMVGASPAP